MATAFHDDGSVDLDGTARDRRATWSSTATTASSSPARPGSRPTTSVAEDGDILRAVKDAVGDRASVVAGVGTNATAHSRRAGRSRPRSSAPTALLLVTPYYNKPGQAGVARTTSAGRRRGHRRAGRCSTTSPAAPAPRSRSRPTRRHRSGDTVVAVKDAVGDFARGVEIMRDWATPSTPATTSPTSAGWPTAPAASSRVVGHVAGRPDPRR